jgi:ankyrin repeat protein
MTADELLLALDDAINRADLAEVEAIIGLGADVNSRDCCGDSPLMSAVWVGAVEIVELLIRHGAEVNAVGAEQQTALDRAHSRGEAAWNYAAVIRILEAAGARSVPCPN